MEGDPGWEWGRQRGAGTPENQVSVSKDPGWRALPMAGLQLPGGLPSRLTIALNRLSGPSSLFSIPSFDIYQLKVLEQVSGRSEPPFPHL